MKKLISLLGTMVLTTSTSTNVIACDGKEKFSKHKTDNEITNDIKNALQNTGVKGLTLNNLQKQSDAQELIKLAIKAVTDQNNVTEATFTFDDSDTLLTAGNNIINIKVTFNTSRNVEVAVKLTNVKVHIRTDLSDLIAPTNSIIVEYDNNYYQGFKSNLINELKLQTKFKSLDLNEIDITKPDNSDLSNDDFKEGTLSIKVKPKLESIKFFNEKIMDVSLRIPVKSHIADLKLRINNNSLLLNGNDLYVGAEFGNIYKVDINTKVVTKIANLGSWIRSLVSSGNVLYAATISDNIYKVEF